MKMIDLPLEQLKEAHWNANEMDEAMLGRLRLSIKRYGLVQGLVVRPAAGGLFKVLSGNQRLSILRELKINPVPSFVVDLDDANARLLAQALNHIHGQDDLGLRAELVRKMLASITQEEALSLLPGTVKGLNDLVSLGQENLAEHLQKWQQAQTARLRHLQFQLTPAQLDIVEAALKKMLPKTNKVIGPNIRSNALYLLCKSYLEKEVGDE